MNKQFEVNKIYNMDCLKGLKQLPNDSINCCITSPPYWALRDYGVKGQLGLEKTPEEYIEKLCNIFDEVKRVLRKNGTCWVNIGDTYYTKSGSNFENDLLCNTKKVKNTGINKANKLSGVKHPFLQQKSLVGIPFMFALEMIKRKWIFRNTIIWHKPSCMPSSAKDRFTVDFEYVFFFVKNKKYYFKQQYEPYAKSTFERAKYKFAKFRTADNGARFNKMAKFPENQKKYVKLNPLGRNKRTVWTINKANFSGQHFAVYPVGLIEPMIDAGCPEQICKKCGKAVREVKKSVGYIDKVKSKGVKIKKDKPYGVIERTGYVEKRNLPPLAKISSYLNTYRKKRGYTIKQIESLMKSQAPHHWFNGESYPNKNQWLKLKKILKFNSEYDIPMTEVKYKPAEKLKSKYITVTETCECNVGFEPGLVLDPFMGAGTTAIVALKQNKSFIGFELNKDYIKIANARIKSFLEQTNLANYEKKR